MELISALSGCVAIYAILFLFWRRLGLAFLLMALVWFAAFGPSFLGRGRGCGAPARPAAALRLELARLAP